MRSAVCIAMMVLAGPAIFTASAAGDPCPFTTVQLDWTKGSVATPSATLDTTAANARITFDRRGRNLTLHAVQGGRATTFVHLSERFMLIGAPAGTPVTATIEFRVEGQAVQDCGGSGCGMQFHASLLAAGITATSDASIAGPGALTRSLDATLAIPVTFVVGEPLTAEFRMDYATGPGAGFEEATGQGTWNIQGLPDGVQAVQCLETTPARTPTWGALKLRYR